MNVAASPAHHQSTSKMKPRRPRPAWGKRKTPEVSFTSLDDQKIMRDALERMMISEQLPWKRDRISRILRRLNEAIAFQKRKARSRALVTTSQAARAKGVAHE